MKMALMGIVGGGSFFWGCFWWSFDGLVDGAGPGLLGFDLVVLVWYCLLSCLAGVLWDFGGGARNLRTQQRAL